MFIFAKMELIVAEKISIQRFGKIIFENTSFLLKKGEHLFISGNNGSGKTSLLKGISKSYPIAKGYLKFPHFEQLKLKNPNLNFNTYLVFVDFNLHHYLPNYLEKFYQQRYHACETDVFPTVMEFLSNEKNIFIEKPIANKAFENKIDQYLTLFKLDSLKNEPVIELSNGESKKLLIIKALLKAPEILILDNPYIGLDTAAVKILDEVLNTLHLMGKTLIMSNADNVYPPIFNTFWNIKDHHLIPEKLTIKESNPNKSTNKNLETQEFENAEILVKMVNAQIIYGEKLIFKQINWTIKAGQKWLLKGENGSGKSSLLGLLFADHPQAYRNEIYLFGKKRGSGESIWDIKKNIGYLSPELYLHFLKPYTCLEIVASGINEYKAIDRNYLPDEIESVMNLLNIFNFKKMANQSFLSISFGEQRLLLLLRALIKKPKLLILDEPFQGIDLQNQQLAMDLCHNYFQSNKSASLILITHQNEFKWNILDNEMELKDKEIRYCGKIR